jgi:hypothetical protein
MDAVKPGDGQPAIRATNDRGLPEHRRRGTPGQVTLTHAERFSRVAAVIDIGT